jgi:SAM-dependent methyltransferase
MTMRLLPLFLCACASVSSLDTDVLRKQTLTLFAAYDRDDATTFSSTIAASFVRFDHVREVPGRFIVQELRGRREANAQPTERKCGEESITKGETFAVYSALCTELSPATRDASSLERSGWNTVMWAREAGTWRAVHWNWKQAADPREIWNDVYRTRSHFERAPNAFLAEVTRAMTTGDALDLMTGQGRNALYLAARGWRVTGIDISDVGLQSAQEAASREHLDVHFIQADVEHHDFGVERWDLVTMIYAGTDHALIHRAKQSIRSGGAFVVEFFAKEGDPMGFARGELAALFADWKVERDECVEDVADWSKQRTWLVRFVARKP